LGVWDDVGGCVVAMRNATISNKNDDQNARISLTLHCVVRMSWLISSRLMGLWAVGGFEVLCMVNVGVEFSRSVVRPRVLGGMIGW